MEKALRGLVKMCEDNHIQKLVPEYKEAKEVLNQIDKL